MLLIPISAREFDLYALSLPRGPNFDPFQVYSAWKLRDSRVAAAILVDSCEEVFAVITMHRQDDHRFVLSHYEAGIQTYERAFEQLVLFSKEETNRRVPRGIKKRPLLLKAGNSPVGEYFKHLTSSITHYPALMAIGEVYLAMPNPDDNFVSDFQTANFEFTSMGIISARSIP